MKLVTAIALFALFAIGPAGLARADENEVTEHRATRSYAVGLEIGPAVAMVTVENAAGEALVDLMVPALSARATFDQDMPVNRHLEIYLADSRSGRLVADQPPIIQITDQANGQERTLTAVMPMYDEAEGPRDLHFGNNLYLPDGVYTVTATMNGENASFADIVLRGEK